MAHFVCSGESVTQMLRNTFLDYGFSRAYQFFTECFVNESIDILLAILKCQKKFVGENEFDLVDDHNPEYLDAVSSKYGTFYRDENDWYRPISIVDGIFSDNMKAYLCAIQYTYQNKKIVSIDKKNYLVEKCDKIPFWMFPTKNVREALITAEKNGTITHISYADFRTSILEEEEGYLRADIRSLLDNLFIEQALARKKPEDTLIIDSASDELNSISDPEIEDLRKKILEQAKDKILSIPYIYKNETKYIHVPEIPFSRWALGAALPDFKDKFPWKNVAPAHYKMENDNPDHTDWLIGAGLYSPDFYLRSSSDPKFKIIQEAIWNYAFDLSQKIKTEYNYV